MDNANALGVGVNKYESPRRTARFGSIARMIGRNIDGGVKGHEASRGKSSQKGNNGKDEKQTSEQTETKPKAMMPIPIEAAVSHVVTAGVGWLAIRFFRAFKRQQKTLQIASGELCL